MACEDIEQQKVLKKEIIDTIISKTYSSFNSYRTLCVNLSVYGYWYTTFDHKGFRCFVAAGTLKELLENIKSWKPLKHD